MLIHRGEIVRDAVYKYCKRTGTSLTAVAKEVGYNQSTVYRHFEKDDLPLHIVARYGKALKRDFTREFPEMEEAFLVKEEQAEYKQQEPLEKCLRELESYQKRYIDLLERHNSLLTQKLTDFVASNTEFLHEENK